MFYLLLPAGICLGTLIPSLIIEFYFRRDELRAAGCVVLPLAPFALGYGILAAVEAYRKSGGGKAISYGIFWNAGLVALMSIVFIVLSRK